MVYRPSYIDNGRPRRDVSPGDDEAVLLSALFVALLTSALDVFTFCFVQSVVLTRAALGSNGRKRSLRKLVQSRYIV